MYRGVRLFVPMPPPKKKKKQKKNRNQSSNKTAVSPALGDLDRQCHLIVALLRPSIHLVGRYFYNYSPLALCDLDRQRHLIVALLRPSIHLAGRYFYRKFVLNVLVFRLPEICHV